MPQHTSNKDLCKHTLDAQTFLVTTARGMAYIHGTATKITVCMDNSQNPLIIDGVSHCSIVAREYPDNHFQIGRSNSFKLRQRTLKLNQAN
ncbi:hypothetical protein O181_009178 [Austropuccinia psidii MF-1]|uniref:Uncharacterized protein n=1 Tax=Austropuccinia psidii MF-1 TaxID=1389203 RepID=A0A9Q3GJ76_9BASI|nr:hypothetical protein [Austropuccinia psidii MF-1]